MNVTEEITCEEPKHKKVEDETTVFHTVWKKDQDRYIQLCDECFEQAMKSYRSTLMSE